jgi:hypothetical protein
MIDSHSRIVAESLESTVWPNSNDAPCPEAQEIELRRLLCSLSLPCALSLLPPWCAGPWSGFRSSDR